MFRALLHVRSTNSYVTSASTKKPNLTSLSFTRSLAVTGRHSKNVAGKKNKLDAARTKLYTRLGVKILMAAKRGGIDPEKNVELSRALKEAHSVSLPKDNIERSLKKASDTSNNEDYKSGTYEIFGHGGVGFLVITLSDNSNRANMAIKAAARKADVKMASGGSVMFQFDQKGILTSTTPYDEERVIEAAIEGGVDEVDFYSAAAASAQGGAAVGEEGAAVEELKLILTSPESLGALQDALTSSPTNMSVTGSLGYIPKEAVSVSDEDWEKNTTVVEALEALDDVDVVYHNMAN